MNSFVCILIISLAVGFSKIESIVLYRFWVVTYSYSYFFFFFPFDAGNKTTTCSRVFKRGVLHSQNGGALIRSFIVP